MCHIFNAGSLFNRAITHIYNKKYSSKFTTVRLLLRAMFVRASAGINANTPARLFFFFGTRNEAHSRTVCPQAQGGGMSSEFLYVNKTRMPLHTPVEIKGLEDQEGREGVQKERGWIFKEDVRNERGRLLLNQIL